MDIFVIHSGGNKEIVKEYLEELNRTTPNFNALILGDGGKFWKIEASAKIKKCQMAVFFVGENSHTSPYIEWEIKQARKHEKPIYTVKLQKDNKLHPALDIYDEYTGKVVSTYSKDVSFKELSEIVTDYEKNNYHVFNAELDKLDHKILLEQYKLFIKTSEDLVSRRQSVSSFYITLNSALVALSSALFAFDFNNYLKILAGIIFSIVGIVVSISWIQTLISYGRLNSSKINIICIIEKHLPASLYDAEWASLSNKLNKKKYVSFTDSEKRVPIIFIIIYSLIILALGGVLIYNYCMGNFHF